MIILDFEYFYYFLSKPEDNFQSKDKLYFKIQKVVIHQYNNIIYKLN